MPPKKKKKEYVGTVKSYNADKGYGFITCEDAMAEFHRDVFVHGKQIGPFAVGDSVGFTIKVNAQGQPQAYELRRIASLAWLASPEQAAEKEEPQQEEQEQMYRGKIKSFNPMKGYGFIFCPAAKEMYDRDVYLHQSQYDGLHVGDIVEFSIRVRDGRPQAHDVEKASTAEDLEAMLRDDIEEAVIEAHRSSSAASGGSPSAAYHKAVGEFRAMTPEVRTKRLLRSCASFMTTSTETMEQLLLAKADPNGIDVTGQRALMSAVLNDRHSEAKLRLLIAHRADPYAPHKDGTVLDWIRERINPKCAQFVEGLHQGKQSDLEFALDSGPLAADD